MGKSPPRGSRDGGGASDRPPPKRSLPAAALRVAVLVSMWYVPSVGLTFYNKWLFHKSRFPMPLTTTLLSFALNSILVKKTLNLLRVTQFCSLISFVAD